MRWRSIDFRIGFWIGLALGLGLETGCTARALDGPLPDGFVFPVDSAVSHNGDAGLDLDGSTDFSSSSKDLAGTNHDGDGGTVGSDGGAGEVPDPYDLRFKWVGAYGGNSPITFYADRGVAGAPNQNLFYDQPSGWLPMQIGFSELAYGKLPDLKPGPAIWLTATFEPTGMLLSMNSLAKAGATSDLATDVAEYTQDGYVVTSVDVSQTPDAFYSFTGATTTDDAGYAAQPMAMMERSALDGFATSEGQKSRIVTALTFSGQMLVFSSARVGDSFIYETQVMDTDLTSLAMNAQTLAQSGYIITAFGRATDAPYTAMETFTMVGTRRKGVTTARDVMVATMLPDAPAYALPSEDPSMLVELGYVIVGWAFDGTNTIAVAER